MEITIQVLSLIGAGIILLSFAMLQSGRYISDSKEYLGTGIVGSMILAGTALLMGNIGFFVLNVAYIAIGIWKWNSKYNGRNK